MSRIPLRVLAIILSAACFANAAHAIVIPPLPAARKTVRTSVTKTFSGHCAGGINCFVNANCNPAHYQAITAWCFDELGGTGFSCEPAVEIDAGHYSETCTCNVLVSTSTADPITE